MSPLPTTSASIRTPECSESESLQSELQSKIRDETQTASEFLPEKSYYYNSKNSYIFPGAELWWKDSDNESVSSDSSSGDDDDVTDMEIDNIRNELEQSYQAPESSTQLNSTYDMFLSNEQAQKENDSSSNCSSNQYDNRSDSTFTSSTLVSTTTAPALSPSAAISTNEFELQSLRKRAASPTVGDLTSSGSIEAIDVENVEKRMKLTDMLLVANSSISDGEISQI